MTTAQKTIIGAALAAAVNGSEYLDVLRNAESFPVAAIRIA